MEFLKKDPTGIYTQNDFEKMDRTLDFFELTPIAFEIIKKIKKNGGLGIAQVCGPMTSGGFGNRRKNFKVLHKTIEYLSLKGQIIFNQLPFGETIERIWQLNPDRDNNQLLLNQFYLPIFESGDLNKLIFLCNWKSSHGANWEHNQAIKLGIKREYVGVVYTP